MSDPIDPIGSTDSPAGFNKKVRDAIQPRAIASSLANDSEAVATLQGAIGGGGGGLAIYGDGSDGDAVVGAPPADEFVFTNNATYSVGDKVCANGDSGSIGVGRRFRCTVGGVAGAFEPSWDPENGTVSGDCTFVDDGDHPIVANTLTRDAFFNDLTVEEGAELNTGNFRLFVRGTLTVNGKLCANGSRSGWNSQIKTGVLGSAAHGGTAVTDALDGVTGDNSGRMRLVPNNIPNSFQKLFLPTGGKGGDAEDKVGGSGGDPTGYEGNWVTPKTFPNQTITADPDTINSAISNNQTGGSGGGSGANASGAGTVGGAAGGGGMVMVLVARNIVGAGEIYAEGGNGDDATGDGNAGGGGGGGGGFIFMAYDSIAETIEVSVDGGLGGAGVGTGSAGENGTPGIIVRWPNA